MNCRSASRQWYRLFDTPHPDAAIHHPQREPPLPGCLLLELLDRAGDSATDLARLFNRGGRNEKALAYVEIGQRIFARPPAFRKRHVDFDWELFTPLGHHP